MLDRTQHQYANSAQSIADQHKAPQQSPLQSCLGYQSDIVGNLEQLAGSLADRLITVRCPIPAKDSPPNGLTPVPSTSQLESQIGALTNRLEVVIATLQMAYDELRV